MTERLLIRTPEPDDAEALNEAILETWDQLHQWLPWARARPTVEESRETCTAMAVQVAANADFPLFCFDRETGEFVAGSGAHTRNARIPLFEIGYWCRAGRQRQRYMTEIVTAITPVIFDAMGARRIEIRCDIRNEASRAVAERCGFVLEGTFKNDFRDGFDRLRTTLVFAQSRDD